jgi:hypothetical protein
MRVLVLTSDHYLHALQPFAYLFNKYWGGGQQVLVGGFKSPEFVLPGNFGFVSLGAMSDYPLDKWSDAFIKFLNLVPDEVFIFMLEDYWLVRPVDTDAVRILYDYMLQFDYVLKVDLCADRLYAMNMSDYGSVSRLDLVQSHRGSPYHMSLMTGLWRKELLLKHVVPGESPWDIEIKGTRRLSLDETMLVLGTRQWPVRHVLAYRGGDAGTEADVGGLRTEDVEEMKRRGYRL